MSGTTYAVDRSIRPVIDVTSHATTTVIVGGVDVSATQLVGHGQYRHGNIAVTPLSSEMVATSGTGTALWLSTVDEEMLAAGTSDTFSESCCRPFAAVIQASRHDKVTSYQRQ